MLKKVLIAVVAGVFIGSVGAALTSLSDLRTKLNDVSTETNKANLDMGLLPNLSDLPGTKKVTESVNNAGIKTLDLTDSVVVLIYGPIMNNGNEIAEHIKSASTRGEPVYVLIDSPGGSIITGGAIVSAIEASPVPVYTVCLQLCASMGAMIHQYGTKRYTASRSILMFHDASGGFMGSFEQMVSQMKTINRFIHKMFAYVAKRSGQNYKDFVSRVGAEIWVDGEDAVDLKYSDEVVNVIHDDSRAVNPPTQETLMTLQQTKNKILNIDYIK
jgi:ATP-dependent Clp protease, protease subunit